MQDADAAYERISDLAKANEKIFARLRKSNSSVRVIPNEVAQVPVTLEDALRKKKAQEMQHTLEVKLKYFKPQPQNMIYVDDYYNDGLITTMSTFKPSYK